MSLVIVKHKSALSLTALCRRVLQFIYEPETLTAKKVREMYASMIAWKQKIDYDVEFQQVDLRQQETLQAMGHLLVRNESGGLEARKKLFRDKQIDYRGFHRLPEFYTKEKLAKAEALMQAYQQKHGVNGS